LGPEAKNVSIFTIFLKDKTTVKLDLRILN
jgi:hypothetical protein